VNSPSGFIFSGISCGIKKNEKDLGLIYSCFSTNTLCLFTSNQIKANSVLISQSNLRKTNNIRAILVNSGNANCCWGNEGLEKTYFILEKLSTKLSVQPHQILIFSTGVIGKRWPYNKIEKKLDNLVKKLSFQEVDSFAESILTTDTFKKVSFQHIVFKKRKVNILGICKGAGMIAPCMATMLAFILTDAYVPLTLLKKVIYEANQFSFLRINVDGCTSTNDSFLIMCNGASGVDVSRDKKLFNRFFSSLIKVSKDLSTSIVKDAEGATKFIRVRIKGLNFEKARKVFLSLSNSLLLKSSFFGGVPAWGRIIQAIGQTGLRISPSDISISYFNKDEKKCVFRKGKMLNKNFSSLKSILRSKEVGILVELFLKSYRDRVYEFYTSDITPQYIKINAGLEK